MSIVMKQLASIGCMNWDQLATARQQLDWQLLILDEFPFLVVESVAGCSGLRL